MAISGDILAVGAYYENTNGQSESGRAYVFNAKSGALISTLTSPHTQFGGLFGISVGISGNLIAVGAPTENASGYIQAGHAYLFNAKTGALVRTFTSPNVQYMGYFGYCVAISGNVVAICAPQENASGYQFAGHAYIFNSSTGALVSTLTSPNAQWMGYFGDSIATDSKIVEVGAAIETVSGYLAAGRAYSFNASTGAYIRTLTSPNTQTGGWFGASVSVNPGIIVVGAPRETASGHGIAGHVYSFNSTTGALIDALASPNAKYYGWFGNSVAANGEKVIVGAPLETADGKSDAGHAYIFGDP